MPAERDLSGEWTVRLDPDRDGLDAGWFETPIEGDVVELPGALRESGIGDPVGPDTEWIGGLGEDFDAPRYDPYREPGSFKMPYWLQPERHYVGVAWYERTVTVPEPWDGRPVELHLERPHWATTVWVDGERIGTRDSLSTAHDYDLGGLAPGRHRVTVRIDNSLAPVDVGENAHSVSDHTQTAWHGIVGDIALRARPTLRIDGARVVGDAADRTARVALALESDREAPVAATVDLAIADDGGTELATERLDVTVPPGGEDVETTLSVEGAPLWDEFDPALCRLEAAIGVERKDENENEDEDESDSDDDATDRTTVRFGLRDVGTEGSRVTLNGRPVTLRGTLECCVFPETGYPPTDVQHWRELLETCTDHGLNHVRFHSWCPPAAAFEAADELGVYLQVECSSWPNQSTSVGEGEPVDDWLYAEADRILAAYGNHPSLCLLAAGNEPGGNDGAYLGEWVPAVRERAEGCLVTGASGWPIIEENAVHVTPEPRIHAWGEGLDDRLNAEPPATTADYRSFVEAHDAPVVAHENGQWCAFPNFDEIDAYTGALQPRNFEVFRDFLEAAGLGDRADAFLAASGALQELCYEEEVESALRTPGMAGFQLLMLHDFPGQGTALVGMLDAHFEPKPYHDTERFRESAGAVVPLARLDRRTFVAGGTLTAELELSQFGPEDLTGATVEWSLTAGDGTVAGGRIDAGRLSTGALHEVGEVTASLDGVDAPAELTLEVDVPAADAHNSWSVWVYPAPDPDPEEGAAEPPADVTVTRRLDGAARERLRDGGRVVLFAEPDRVATDVDLGFTPIFWNTAWTDGQAPHTLGLRPDPEHPALAGFPTEAHTDWQWWDAVASGATMELEDLPADLDPIVEVVPDWFDPKRLGLAFEARVLEGRLLVCSIDPSGADGRPATRQLRRSLLDYAGSAAFDPDVTVDVEAVRGLFDGGE